MTPWTIHVVDDDEPVRDALVFALQAVGFRAVTWIDAADFLTHEREEHDLLLSDVRMKGIDGIELTRQLRRNGSTMPIILMTGHADSELLRDATNAGAHLVMAKPLALTALITGITQLTGG